MNSHRNSMKFAARRGLRSQLSICSLSSIQLFYRLYRSAMADNLPRLSLLWLGSRNVQIPRLRRSEGDRALRREDANAEFLRGRNEEICQKCPGRRHGGACSNHAMNAMLA